MITSMSSMLLERRTITIPAEVAQAVTERVGLRGFSSYATDAIAQRLRMDVARELLTEIEAINGPTDQNEVKQIRAKYLG